MAIVVVSWSQVFIFAYRIVTLKSNLLEVCMGPWITVVKGRHVETNIIDRNMVRQPETINLQKHSSAMEVQVTTLAGECWTFQADNWTLRDLKARENPDFCSEGSCMVSKDLVTILVFPSENFLFRHRWPSL